MHGIIKPQPLHDSTVKTDWPAEILGWARRNKWFLIIVMLMLAVLGALRNPPGD